MVPHHLVANEGQVTLKMDGFNSCVNGIGSLVQKLKTGFWGCLVSSSAYISYRSSTCWGTCHLLRLQIIIESHYHLPSLWLLSFRFYSQLECANSTTLSGWPRERSKTDLLCHVSAYGIYMDVQCCLTRKYTTGSRWCIRFPWNLALCRYNWFTPLTFTGFAPHSLSVSPYVTLSKASRNNLHVTSGGTSTEHDGCLNTCQITGFLDSTLSKPVPRSNYNTLEGCSFTIPLSNDWTFPVHQAGWSVKLPTKMDVEV